MIKKNIKAVVRISRYKNALYRFKKLGFERVFSNYLADATGVSAVQVRKDFSLFGITGNKRGGYQIAEILEKLYFILGKTDPKRLVLAGAGKIGAALLQYSTFEQEGIRIVAAFDIDPSKIGRCGTVPVFPLEQLHDYIRDNHIGLGILCVPDIAAQQVCNIMISAGVKGILNFAPIQLQAPEDCVVNNVNLVSELESLVYFVNLEHWPTAENGK